MFNKNSNIEFWFKNFFFKPLKGAYDGPFFRYSLEQKSPLAMLVVLLRELYKQFKYSSILDISESLKSKEILRSIKGDNTFEVKRKIILKKINKYDYYDGDFFMQKNQDYIVNSKEEFELNDDKVSLEKFDIVIISTGFLRSAFDLDRVTVIDVIQKIINKNMNDHSKLILIDDSGVLKESDPSFISSDENKKDIIERFKEKNAFRLYGSVFNYEVEDIYKEIYSNGEAEKIYDDQEIRFYILSRKKTKRHFVLRKTLSFREINYLGDLLQNKDSIWVKNIFNENFSYPGNSWFNDDIFNWEPEYYTKSKDFWKNQRVSIEKLFEEEKIKYYINDRFFKYQFKNEFYEKRKIEIEIIKLDGLDEIELPSVLLFSLVRPETFEGSKKVFYPKFTINEFIKIMDDDPFSSLFMIKQNFKSYERNEFFNEELIFKTKEFIEYSDYDKNFAESIQELYEYNKDLDEKNFSKYDIISLDLTYLNYDENKLYKFLLNALKLVNEKHSILVWVRDDVLNSKEYQEFRELYSNNISSVIKLNNSFLLKFQKGHQVSYLASNFQGQFRPYTEDSATNQKNKEFDESLEKFLIKYDNKSLQVEKNDEFVNDWSVAFKHVPKVTVSNSDILNKITNYYEDLKGGQQAMLSNQQKMLDQINEVKIQSKQTFESIDQYNKRIENAVNKILQIVEESKNINEIIIEDYIPRIKKWFNFWDLLEKESKVFMPRSEYLYDSIESSDFDDYSPFVLYYSRVLEVELFQKIFKKFGVLMRKKYDDISVLFYYDESISRETKEGIEKGPVNLLKNNLQKDSPKYNLGDMRLILNLLPDSKKPKGSKRYQALDALKELDVFINGKTGGIPKKLISKIEKLIREYRNPSAHVGTIDKKQAKVFFENYKDLMNELIGLFDKK